MGVLAGLPNPFTATRYHSLTIRPDTVPAELEVTGRTSTGVIMALRHRSLPIAGVQFHPESVLTESGHRLLANWMADSGHPVPEPTVAELTAEVAALVGGWASGQVVGGCGPAHADQHPLGGSATVVP